MCVGNPGEIDFGPSQRKVRISEGSSHRESTVCLRKHFFHRNLFAINFLHIFSMFPFYLCKMLPLTFLNYFSKNPMNSEIVTLYLSIHAPLTFLNFWQLLKQIMGMRQEIVKDSTKQAFWRFQSTEVPILFDDVTKSYHTRTMHPACGMRGEGRHIADRFEMIAIAVVGAK